MRPNNARHSIKTVAVASMPLGVYSPSSSVVATMQYYTTLSCTTCTDVTIAFVRARP